MDRLIHRWRPRSLNAKLLLPIVGLMLISLLGSTLVFVAGTALTRNQLLEQQIAADAERVAEAMKARVETVTSAATMLASDPRVFVAAQEDGEEPLSVLNSRAVVVRDRLGLDLIQIYDQQGEARANLMLSNLYHESSLLGRVGADAPVVRVVEGRALLLSRATMPDEGGTVIAGIDLETELQRLVSRYRLSADLGLSVAGFHVGTREDLPFESPDGQTDGQYSRHLPLTLGETSVDLLLVRPTSDIAQVTNTGLSVMVGSMLLTTLLLMGLSAVVIRAIVRPIRRLSAAAAIVSRGNLKQQMEMTYLASPFGIGNEDEIGLLAATFNRMVDELRGLYQDLEAKVEARTGELTAANARLKELDRTKDEFIQNVSHELRTPLALIRGYVELLESETLGELQEEQRQPVAIIARRCRIMTKLVEDITTLLEIEARPPEMAPVSLSALAQTVVEDFEDLAERNRLALHAEIAPHLPPVMGEERYLHRVVDNLVNNALKFTPAGGAVALQLFQENGRVILQVSDDGIGIPAEKQARVFERFYQVDGSTRRRYGGTGLGLALVKEIVEAHGGQVTLESELERGSRFRVAIPATATDNSG